MLRILLAIIGFLVAPIVATFTYILVKQSLILLRAVSQLCRHHFRYRDNRSLLEKT